MARGINKVILVGNLGADPDVRHTNNGSMVCNLRLATTRSWKDKQTGQTVEETEWSIVVIFGKLAEIAAQYLKKGAQIYIEGRLRTRKWQDQSGNDRYTTEVVANDMQMLGGKPAEASGSDYAAARQKGGSPPTPQNQPQNSGFDDEDIPF